MVVKMWIVVSCVVMPFSLLGGYQRFGGTYCLHLQNMEVAGSMAVTCIEIMSLMMISL
jgi:hypothetical protein